MDDREDGEISGSDCDLEENSYTALERPVCPDASLYRNSVKNMPSSDEDSSSDSDNACLPKRKKCQYSQMEFERNGGLEAGSSKIGVRKTNNIWANVLQEEVLTQEIGGVGLKKVNSDRNVESYDYTQALRLHNQQVPDSDDEAINDDDESETEENIQKRMNRKRSVHNRMNDRRKHKSCNIDSPRNLIDIGLDPSRTDEELGYIIAEALFESKPELIVKSVEVLGQEKALKLYAETQEVEKKGGMLVLNGMRRRTSGGVYLQLLKTFDGVTKANLLQIFSEDAKASNQWRKRKRMNRRRRHDSKNQVGTKESLEDDGLHLKGLFTDDPGGPKCPGSTPVTTPQGSDVDESSNSPCDLANSSLPFPLQEVCEKAALEVSKRSQLTKNDEIEPHPLPDEMDVF